MTTSSSDLRKHDNTKGNKEGSISKSSLHDHSLRSKSMSSMLSSTSSLHSLADSHNSESAESARFFPILPYAFSNQIDINGWYTDYHPRSTCIIQLIHDNELDDTVIEINQSEIRSTHIWGCMIFPNKDQYIGTHCSILNIQLKNIGKFVAIEIDITDTTNNQRTFRFSNSQSIIRRRDTSCHIPLQLCQGWNKLYIDLEYLCRIVYTTSYSHALRVRIYNSCRLRRVFFSDQKYPPSLLPNSLTPFRHHVDVTDTSGIGVAA